jgi:hypothetical protein
MPEEALEIVARVHTEVACIPLPEPTERVDRAGARGRDGRRGSSGSSGSSGPTNADGSQGRGGDGGDGGPGGDGTHGTPARSESFRIELVEGRAVLVAATVATAARSRSRPTDTLENPCRIPIAPPYDVELVAEQPIEVRGRATVALALACASKSRSRDQRSSVVCRLTSVVESKT